MEISFASNNLCIHVTAIKKPTHHFSYFFSVAVWMALFYALSVVVPRSADAYSPNIHGNLFWSVSGESRQTTRKDLH